MNEVNINQIKTRQINFDSSLEQRAGVFPTPQFIEAEELFKATGLPDDILFSALTFREFLSGNPDARNLQSFKDSFSSVGTNLDENQFTAIFQDFSEDQVAHKGSFSPSEAFLDWDAYVKERNDTQKHMETVADDLAKGVSVQYETTGPSGPSGPQSVKPKDPLGNIGRLLEKMMDLFEMVQEIGMIYAKELEIQTLMTEDLMEKQDALKPLSEGLDVWVKNSKGDKIAKETIKSNMDAYNNNILSSHQERIRSLKDQVDARARQINSKLSRVNTMTSNINEDLNSELSRLMMWFRNTFG